MSYRDLTEEPSIQQARHAIDRALESGDQAQLALWAREWRREACDALLKLHAAADRDDEEWGY